MEGRTKKERREAARRERERILKQQARRRQLQRLTAIGIGAAIVVVVLALFLLKPGSSDETSNASESLPGIQTGPPPWPPELAHLRQRLQRLGLPAQPSMAANLHHHDLLQIFDHGDPVTVPESIGIDPTAGFLTSIHTHDSSGIIHVESPTQRSFNLGEFFDVWGLRLTSTCIGGLCDSGEDQLRAFVDGKPWTSSPREIPLKQHEDIVLTFGTEAEQPSPIPSDYSKSISKTCAPDC